VNPVPSGHDPPGKETEAEFSVLAAPVDCSWISVTGALARKPDCLSASSNIYAVSGVTLVRYDRDAGPSSKPTHLVV